MMRTKRHRVMSGITALAAVAGSANVVAGEAARATKPLPGQLRKQVQASIDRALDYLKTAQEPDGSWAPKAGPAITALVARCFAEHPGYGPKHPIVRKALECVLKHRQPDGGIYDAGVGMRNYTTSICLMFLASLPESDSEVRQAREQAVRFLKNLQWAEHRKGPDGKAITPDHVWYGGAGYGRHKRPDLSNTQMMLEALNQSGLPKSDPTYKKAVRFIERCQMLSETNDQLLARRASDGGFIYTPANGGESKAGTVTVDGQPMLRSYGSMTYAGFKSLLHANVSRDDVRVQRAWDWIRKHYTLNENPNMPGKQSKQGLYYYYHVFARALNAWGKPSLTDAKGLEHDWRIDLCQKLVSLQRPEGYWVNEADRWMEGLPPLVTAYAVRALQTAVK